MPGRSLRRESTKSFAEDVHNKLFTIEANMERVLEHCLLSWGIGATYSTDTHNTLNYEPVRAPTPIPAGKATPTFNPCVDQIDTTAAVANYWMSRGYKANTTEDGRLKLQPVTTLELDTVLPKVAEHKTTTQDKGDGEDKGMDEDKAKGEDEEKGKNKGKGKGKGKDEDEGKSKGEDEDKGKGEDEEKDEGKGEDEDKDKGKGEGKGEGEDEDEGKNKDKGEDKGKGDDEDKDKNRTRVKVRTRTSRSA